MPFLPADDPGPMLNPFRAVGAPDGYVVTPDDINSPKMGPEPPPPTWGDAFGASFRLENEVVGMIRSARERSDFGADDPDHNPWDTIKDDPILREHSNAFLTSRNSAETEFIRDKIYRETEDRRIREASGLASAFLTDATASILSPTTLLPGGGIYKGWKYGSAGLRSAASVGAMAAAGVTVQEIMLQQQQLTRTLTESLLNVGGATILGGLLGGGLSFRQSRQLSRASARIDADIARIAQERELVDASARFDELELKAKDGVLTPEEIAERDALKARLDEPPFGASAGAAVSRPLQENIPASAFGLEKVFAFQGPFTRAVASGAKTVRDVATRLAESPLMMRQNRAGIATGPAGGSVEARIKIDGDVALYRANKALYEGFAEYRYGRPDAKLARGRAAFADMTKPQPGRYDWKEFKRQVTAALRAETKEHGIEHPVPQVKAAAIAYRKEVFEPFKKEALRLGLLPEEAEHAFGYVMRRWDVAAIMNDYARFHRILLDHLRSGQAAALRDLARLESELEAVVRSGDMGPEVSGLARQVDEVRERFRVDEGTVDSIMQAWRFVVKDKPKKPLSLSEWIKREGGLHDEGRTLEHMLGGRQAAGRLINNKRGMRLDDAALRAFEKGYFDERPHINAFLDAIDDDVRSDGTSVFSREDAEALESWRAAEDMRAELEEYGIANITSEKRARKEIVRQMREANASPAAQRARDATAEDREFLDGLTKIDTSDPDVKAAVDDARLDAEARVKDGEAVTRRIEDDDGPVFAQDTATREAIRATIERGRTYTVADDIVDEQLMELEAGYGAALPDGASFGAVASIAPAPGGKVVITFRTAGSDIVLDPLPADFAYNIRAMYLPAADVVVGFGAGERIAQGVQIHVDSGIYHEFTHAHLYRLPASGRVPLVAHADSLRVLDMQLGTFLRAVGNPNWRGPNQNQTLREVYTKMYGKSPNLQARLDQEAVAHMQELHYVGHFSDDDVAPVLNDLIAMRGGAPSVGPKMGDELSTMPLAARAEDLNAGAAMRTELDALGYRSQALEAAKKWQNKGTSEQALAWLKKSGVKDAEIKATKVDEFLAGKPTVTKDELTEYLRANRVELREASNRIDDDKMKAMRLENDRLMARQRELDVEMRRRDADYDDRDQDTYNRLFDELGEVNARLEDLREHDIYGGNGTMFSDYSLHRFDPKNSTYAETRLYLPDHRRDRLRELGARYQDLSDAGSTEAAKDLAAEIDRLNSDIDANPGVRSHFAENNVVGHMQTTMQAHQGKPVFTVNQIQSDWGQRLRDRGEFNPEDIAQLRIDRDAAVAEMDRKTKAGNDLLPQHLRVELNNTRGDYTSAEWVIDALNARAERVASSRVRRMTGLDNSEKLLAAASEIRASYDAAVLLGREIYAKSGGVQSHPLVGSTDQWVNTTLRRALRQAVEADAEYIAIPTGDTVLSYNPGDTKGMREFYGAKPASADEVAAAKAAHEAAVAQYGESSAGAIATWGDWKQAADRQGNASGIVPKNLRKLLEKFDKDAKPELVDTLDSPLGNGPRNLGKGFTIFPLTDKVKAAVRGSDGQPMFAVDAGGEAPRVEVPPELLASARALAERMGVKLPDELADMDLDDALASLTKALDAMDERAFRGNKIARGEADELRDQVAELRKFAEMDEQGLSDIVRGTIAKLTGSPVARGNLNPYDEFITAGPSGPLHARTLKIDDAKVVDFLDDDIEEIGKNYVRAMAPDVAIAREFGDLNMTEDLTKIEDEYQTLLHNATAPAERNRILKQKHQDIKDIQDMAARLRGTLNIAHDPMSWGPRAAAAAKKVNVLRLMGAVLAASIADVPKLLFNHGFRSNADLLATLVSDFQGLRMAKAEAREMSAGLEFIFSRSGQMWDTFDDIRGHTMPERALTYAVNKFGRINLMDQWNSTLKQLSGAMSTNRILRTSLDIANGRLKAGDKDVTRLAAGGIDADLARIIAEQYQKHGANHGRLLLANINEWDDLPQVQLAKRALMSAVRRDADMTIVTPGQEKPTMLSRTYMSMIGQFRSFQMSSIQRTLIAGLQDVDAAKVVALTGMIGLGMMAEQLKIIIHGKEQKRGPQDAGEWLYAGLANSGFLGWLTDADQFAHKISGGNVSVARWGFGNDRPISRFASQNWIGSALGPTYGAAYDVGRAVNAGLTRNVTEGDVHAMRRLIPYQNLFYISRSLRALEEGLIEAGRIPRQQQRN